MNEAGRDLDRLRREGLRRQTKTGGGRSGRAFHATNSITVCAFTTDPTEAALIRLPIEANEENGLRIPLPANGG